MIRITVTLLLLLVLSACEDFQGGAKATKSTGKDEAAIRSDGLATQYQRFVPVQREPGASAEIPWSGAFALDTKTGQLCRTYPWEIVGSSQDHAKVLNAIPKCLDLFREREKESTSAAKDASGFDWSKWKAVDPQGDKATKNPN